jgi:hypothetical protein
MNQQLVDPFLRRMVTRLLAYEDALSVATGALQHCGGHQPIVKNHVRLLQQLQGTQCEQIWVAGPGANEITLTQSAAARSRRSRQIRRSQLTLKVLVRFAFIASEYSRTNDAAYDSFPE